MIKALSGIIVISLFSFLLRANNNPAEGKRINILVLLDASFSMKEKWQSRSKFEIAAEAMVEIIESSFKEDPHRYFAFRLFGHGSGMNLNDCDDTELVIDFGQRNIDEIIHRLNELYPKGWSPIALSINEAITDFQGLEDDINALIFITDGGETCSGKPCEAAGLLAKSGIIAMPFVVGLGDSEFLIEDVGCIGDYRQVNTEERLKEGLEKIIDKIDLKTTVQVYFLDHTGNKNETNIPFSIKSKSSEENRFSFVHTLSAENTSDTMKLSTFSDYDLIAHTTPELVKEDINLQKNQHNLIMMTASSGELELVLQGDRGFADFECVVRDPETNNIINVQHFDSKHSYLVGTYDLEFTTFPRTIFESVKIESDETRTIQIERSGNILIRNVEPVFASIYLANSKNVEKIRELYEISGSNSYALQPGSYLLIYNYSGDDTVNTREYEFSIKAGRVTTIEL